MLLYKQFIWWLSQDDYDKIPKERPRFIPANIWSQVKSREGRAGRCRLWIPDVIEYKGMPELGSDAWIKFQTNVKHDVGGIVILPKNAEACVLLAGILTDENLNLIKP